MGTCAAWVRLGAIGLVATGCGVGGSDSPGRVSCLYRAPDGGVPSEMRADGFQCLEYGVEYSDGWAPTCPVLSGYTQVSECPSARRIARCDVDTTSPERSRTPATIHSYATTTSRADIAAAIRDAQNECGRFGGAFTEL